MTDHWLKWDFMELIAFGEMVAYKAGCSEKLSVKNMRFVLFLF